LHKGLHESTPNVQIMYEPAVIPKVWQRRWHMRSEAAEAIAADVIRAVRGRRTQTAFSRVLGYRSNIARRWESQACFPTASAFLTACTRLRPASARVFQRFFSFTPSWLDEHDPFSPACVAAFLRELRGKTPIGVLASRTDYNRYQVARWLHGKTQPKLPEFLSLVEAASRRLLDLIAQLVDPAVMPTVASDWKRLTRAREAMYDAPWSHAVLRALELVDYARAPSAERSAWLARALGLSEAEVQAGIDVLADSGQIRTLRGRWQPNRVLSVDTGHDPRRARGVKVAWAQVAVERMRAGVAGSFGYSLFAISRRDLARLRDLHLEYVRAMQSLIASSAPAECVGLYCAQLFDLAAAP
jgi:hypothetical protein